MDDSFDLLPSPRIETLVSSNINESQTSLSVPSNGSPQNSSLAGSQSSSLSCSHPSSFPSPNVTSLEKLLASSPTSVDALDDAKKICSFLEKTSFEGKMQVFSFLTLQCDGQSLARLNEETINHLSNIFGEFCREKIRHEADTFRFKRSREDTDLSSVEILSKRLKIEQLHIFYESATGKSGRSLYNWQDKVTIHQDWQEKVANHQATFYESLLKGANLNTLGPFNLAKVAKLNLKVQSKALFENQLRGCYKVHQNIKPSMPIPMSFTGPLIR